MATYYFRSTGTNWGTTGDWSATPSPSYTAGAVPTTADDAVFESASANCTINAGATRNCVNLTCTSYTGTLTFNTNLTVSGNVSLGSASMVMTGSSTLSLVCPIGSSRTHSSAGCVCAVPLSMSTTSQGGTTTITWGSNWTQSGTSTIANTTLWVWNGNTVIFKNNVAWNASSRTGTTNIEFAPDAATTMNVTSTGTPNWSFPLTINGAGTINLNLTFQKTNTFTWTAGTVNHTGTIIFAPGTTTMNTAGMSFQNGQNSASATSTIVLTSDLTFTGNYVYTSSATSFNPAGRSVFVGGNLTIGVGLSNLSTLLGASTVVMNGSGTISGTALNAMTCPLIINTSGTITFSGSIAWLRTLTFNSGTIVSTGSSINCASSSTFTLNAPGFSFASLTCTTTTLAGTEGCTFGTFTSQTAGAICTFQSTETYTINTALNLLGTAASNVTFRSSSAGSLAIVNLVTGASLDVGHVTATDINSSGGRTIWVYKGTIGAATLNWQQLPTVPKTIGETWVS